MSRLLFLGLGAAMMFFGDPQTGRRRRTDVRNQIDATRRRIEHTKSVIARDATNRAHGLLVETRGALQSGAPALAEVARDAVAAWGRPQWSPAQRALGGACGAGLATAGYFRGGLKGLVMCTLGGALLARATANQDLAMLVQSPPASERH